MTQNSNAIITLCSHLCVGDDVIPLEPKEWSELAAKLMKLGLQPQNIFDFSVDEICEKLMVSKEYSERIMRLSDRNASLMFEISEYENMGIKIVTRADKQYPQKLKLVLGNGCPPLFYYAGDLNLLGREYIGYVGSRSINEDDEAFVKMMVGKTTSKGYGVVSGGAKGIDAIAEEESLKLGAPTIAYLADSMLTKMKKSHIIRGIGNKQLLLLSVVKPNAPFNTGVAMMRNKYIYAQSKATMVVKSELNKGGTWAGATENLKHGWCKQLCRNKDEYPGNTALIQQGSVAVDEMWNGDLELLKNASSFEVIEQISMFDNNQIKDNK